MHVMSPEARRWFDSVYDGIRGTGFVHPFGNFTNEVTDEEIRMQYGISGVTLPGKRLEYLRDVFRRFRESRPSPEEFAEEKEEILRRAAPEMQRIFCFADSAVSFGRLVGDIDIGLLSSHGISDDEIIYSIRQGAGRRLIEKYPIIDEATLYTFRSKNGEELASKIRNTRHIMSGFRELSLPHYSYICETISGARLIYGNENELESMKAYGKKLPSCMELVRS